jgi:NADH-quinone oxidoreductase subunit A
MNNWLLSPPVAFLVLFIFLAALSYLFSFLSLRVKKKSIGSGEAYACGESNYNAMAQPDYSQFFPFAFFFTIAHVAALMLTTIPIEEKGVLALALLYLLAVVAGLFILLGRNN